MIFWILTAIIAIAWVGTTVALWWDDWADGLFVLFVGGILAGAAWGLLAVLLVGNGIPRWIGVNHIESETANLRALGADSSVEGRFFFLGGGYINGERVLSYIRENGNGSFTPDQVTGSASEVFESDDATPTMVTREHVADYWWLAPPVTVGWTYEFTVPVGSVAEQYRVEP